MSATTQAQRDGVEVRSNAPAAITAALQDAVDRGRALVDDGEVVEDEVAYQRWRDARREWVRETLRTLAQQFEAEAVDEFVHANKATSGSWEERLRHDVRTTSDAVELVHWLGTTLSNWRSECYPSGLSRARRRAREVESDAGASWRW